MRKLLWILSLIVIAAFPATARADGIAFAGVKQGGDGIASADGLAHYVTLPIPKQTVVTKIGAEGSVLAFRALPGAWGIPMVAFDGSVGGLSADGRMLVLAQPPIGRMRQVSRFPILQTRNLQPIEIVTLEGSFSFDALSPDGSTLYLIEHVNRNDVAEYQVRAYDLGRKRLLPYVIRDHRSNQVEMYGYPMSRATSADGRWAYTLYQGSHHSFVHALDTVARKAVCIDLPMDTPPEHVGDARLVLGPGGRNLTVDSRTGGTLAVLDTEKLELRPERPDRRAAPPSEERFPWLLLAGAFAVAFLAAGFRVRRLRLVPAVVADHRRDQAGPRETQAYLEEEPFLDSSFRSTAAVTSPPTPIPAAASADRRRKATNGVARTPGRLSRSLASAHKSRLVARR